MGKRLDVSVRKQGSFPDSMVVDLKKPNYDIHFVLKDTERRRGGVYIEGPKGLSGFLNNSKYPVKGFPYEVDGLEAGKTYTLKLQQAAPRKRMNPLAIQVEADVVTRYVVTRADEALKIQRKPASD